MDIANLIARIAALFELFFVFFNMIMAFVWFISLIWVLVGALWCLLGLALLLETGLVMYVLVRGYTPLAFIGPVIALGACVCNFNFISMPGPIFVLLLYIAAAIARAVFPLELDKK